MAPVPFISRPASTCSWLAILTVRQRPLGLSLRLLHPVGDEVHHPDDEGQHDNGGCEQDGVLPDQVARHDHHGHRIAHRPGGREAEEHAKLLRLRHQPVNDLARLGALEIGEVERHQMSDQVTPHLEDRLVRQPHRHQRHEVRHQPAHREKEEDAKTDQHELPDLAAFENHPQAAFGHRQELLIDQPLDQDHHENRPQPGRALFQVALPEPAQVAAVLGRKDRLAFFLGFVGHGRPSTGFRLPIVGSGGKVSPRI
jgi:hypothetical protein